MSDLENFGFPDIVGSSGLGGGNTKSPPRKKAKTEKVKKKRANGAKRWCFTWNNYPENWVALLAPVFEGSEGWIGGREVAPETGTKHIQGYVEFEFKTRPIGYRGAPKQIHWGDENGKPAKGTRAQNIAYCAKDGDVEEASTFKAPRPLPVIEPYGWQLDKLKDLDQEPEKRTIHWIWSDAASRGKSDFARVLVQDKGFLICSGKAADMKYLIVKHKERTGDYPWGVVFDVPRSSFKYLSYTGIEEIKNGVFASTKFECAPVVMPYCHVVVLSNFAPDLDNVDMSANRFVVLNVD